MQTPHEMEYWLRIDGASGRPLSKEEIFTKYRDRLRADTPCCRVGENQWRKLADYFPDWESLNPQEVNPSTLPETPAASDERYPALRIIGVFFRIFAVVSVGMAFVGVMIGPGIGFTSGPAPGLMVIGSLFVGFWGALTNLAIAEGIDLLLDIEKNTRQKSPVP